MPTSNLSAEYRHMRSGSLTIPPQNGHAQVNANGNGSSSSSTAIMNQASGANRFEGPRSPPNTSHVPCKFFRQGQCQAGNACPFSHDIGSAAETVCKYFAKGNCKFGPKCANIHVLPDGRRVNYTKSGVTIGTAPINLGSRVNPTTYHHPTNTNSALTNSFMRADGHVPPYTAASPYGNGSGDDLYHHLGRRPSLENGLPTIDTTYSHSGSAYGSPRDEDPSRLMTGLSPANNKGLSVMDAPLPASFDSNGISLAARYGPWPASVPSKFGLESPSPSLNMAKENRTSETLKLLHTSAFGSNDFLSPSNMHNPDNGMGSSPPTQPADEYFGRRAMHSSRYAKPRLLSSSAPKVDRDWEAEFLFYEEDYVPGALANEVLTPAEKARRGSLRLDLNDAPSSEPSTKFGSPSAAASPSRWGPLFQRQREEEHDSIGKISALSPSARNGPSAFGHVGSPLRNSSLAIGDEMSLNGSANGASRTSGSHRTANEPQSLSVLTQQLRKTSLGDEGSGSPSPRLHPNSARVLGGGPVASTMAKERDRTLERHISNGSLGSSVTGRFTTPIDEEDPAFVFSMEEDEAAELRSRKRMSSGLSIGTGWSYAGVAAGKTNGAGSGPRATPRQSTAAMEAVGGR